MSKKNSFPESTPAQNWIAFFTALSFILSLINFLGFDKNDLINFINNTSDQKDEYDPNKLFYEANSLLADFKLKVEYLDSLDRVNKIDSVAVEFDNLDNPIKFDHFKWTVKAKNWLTCTYKVEFQNNRKSFIQLSTRFMDITKEKINLSHAEQLNNKFSQKNNYYIIFRAFRDFNTKTGTFGEWQDTYLEIKVYSTGIPPNPSDYIRLRSVNSSGTKVSENEEKLVDKFQLDKIVVDSTTWITGFVTVEDNESFIMQPDLAKDYTSRTRTPTINLN